MSENLLKIFLQKSFEKAQLSNKNKLHFHSCCFSLWEGAHYHPFHGQMEPVNFGMITLQVLTMRFRTLDDDSTLKKK